MPSSSHLTVLMNIATGADFPTTGEFLKVQLPSPLSDLFPESFPPPTSFQTRPSQASGSSYRSGPSHSVIVRSITPGTENGVRVFNLEVWVIVTLSKADEMGRKSTAKFLSWPGESQMKWLPLPCRPSPDGGGSRTPTSTPPLFGPPLEIGGFYDTTAQWMSVATMRLKITEQTKASASESLSFKLNPNLEGSSNGMNHQ